MKQPFLVSDKWYDIRDLSNLSNEILHQVDRALPGEAAYILSPLLGFVFVFLLFVLPTQLYLGVLGERKIIGRMQSRYGPNRTGKFGVLQPIADAAKLLTKEALTPRYADKTIMYLAPVLFVMPAVMVWAVIPFGPEMIIADIPNSLVYYLAVSSVPTLVIFMGGWSHNNKYSLFGAIRIVAMGVSYEVPLVMALLGVVVMTGSLSLNGIVFWQDAFDIWLVALQPLAFAIFFICVSAELNRTPVDIAEAESELGSGYLTEYSGMKWGLFYGMDIAYALAASALGATIFFGGWSFFGLQDWVPSWLFFIGKLYAFYFLFIWTRGTLPRLRIDQLMAFCWKYLFPLALFNLFIVATERVIWTDGLDGEKGFVYIFAAANILATIVLVVTWARFLGYRPENQTTKPRLVNEAGGYVPVTPASGEGR
ncbi:MAG: NADH-quinone oxidoreductase subunit NuoH [Dehalococcoidia bacterium]|nr:NADH-quinone oxidoreductase subunit NuoH [Dehalococcoidia bacterium]